jgi:excinuclease ABC subunit B
MAEDLTEYLKELGLKVRWLHSDIKALERVELLHDLRMGAFDVLVGVNLLREGLDLPEVSLVAIMEADKEGFLRAERSLIQTIGRAARNVDGRVILYAGKTTESMAKALSETNRRRDLQVSYNLEHNITPTTIVKETSNSLLEALRGRSADLDMDTIGSSVNESDKRSKDGLTYGGVNLPQVIRKLEKEMKEAAKSLDFEKAAELRDQLKLLQEELRRQAKP